MVVRNKIPERFYPRFDSLNIYPFVHAATSTGHCAKGLSFWLSVVLIEAIPAEFTPTNSAPDNYRVKYRQREMYVCWSVILNLSACTDLLVTEEFCLWLGAPNRGRS